jgi:hypothetical protein
MLLFMNVLVGFDTIHGDGVHITISKNARSREKILLVVMISRQKTLMPARITANTRDGEKG